MTKKIAIAAFILGSLAAEYGVPLFAAGPGTTTGELLKIPVGARGIGMGEANTAAADDASSLESNPAGLSYAEQKEASFMHSSLIEDVNYEHIGVVVPSDNYSWGASMGYLGYGSIAGYSNAAPGGTPVALGDQSAYSTVFNGGLSTILYDRLSLGLTGMFLRESLANDGANTFAGNIGAIYGLPSQLWGGDYRLGFSVLNLGPGLKFESERDPLPRKIKMGASAMHIEQLPLNLTADFTMPNDNSDYVSLGAEYWFREVVALRMGYAGSNDQGKGLRLGLGLKLRNILFDYAYGSFGDFGATHRIELSLRWGDKVHQLSKEQRAILKEAMRAGNQGDYIQQILAMNELLEQDPTNDHILKNMIVAHEHMLQSELKEAIASNDSKKDVPSPEEFALQDLVPGQQSVSQIPGSNANAGFDPRDPLSLSTLPDAATAVGDVASPAPAQSPAVVPAPSAPPMVDTQPNDAPSSSPAAPASDGVLLNPTDIYGQ
jgi:hypothetical protein